LVVQGDNRTFNPTLSASDIAAAEAADPEAGTSAGGVCSAPAWPPS
jgi:hypothetical protein